MGNIKGLGKIQKHTLSRLRSGWEMGVSHHWGQHCWIQKGRIGEGGISEDVSYSTFKTLFDRGLLKRKGTRHNVAIFGAKK